MSVSSSEHGLRAPSGSVKSMQPPGPAAAKVAPSGLAFACACRNRSRATADSSFVNSHRAPAKNRAAHALATLVIRPRPYPGFSRPWSAPITVAVAPGSSHFARCVPSSSVSSAKKHGPPPWSDIGLSASATYRRARFAHAPPSRPAATSYAATHAWPLAVSAKSSMQLFAQGSDPSPQSGSCGTGISA